MAEKALTVTAQNMDFYWFVIGVACACAALLPLRYLRPAHKRIYVPAAIYVSAILWGAFIGCSLDGGPLLSGAILVGILVNATYVVRQTRVCQVCGAIVGLKRGAKEVHACNPDDLLVDAASPQAEAVQIDAPPRGFRVTTAANGDLVIDYQTTGMGCFGCFITLFLAGWTTAAGFITYDILFRKHDDTSWAPMVMWLPIPLIAGATIWYFFSVTTISLSSDALIARRRLGPIRRERRLERSALTLIKIVKDGGESGKDRDTFPSWGLVVRGPKELRILSRQPQEQVLWLGRLLAKWSGLTLKDAGSPVLNTYETL